MFLIRTEVFCEDTNTSLVLNLTEEQYARAIRDTIYLNQLVNEVRFGTSSQESQLESSKEPEDLSEAVVTNEELSEAASTTDDDTSSAFIWTNSAVLLLLTLYEEHEEDFTVRKHKKVWDDIAEKMRITNPTLNITGLQCQTKLNGLKRTYKKIIDHNNTSGNNRASWPFFERMHEIFGGTRLAQPLAVAPESGPFLTTQENNDNENRPAKKKKLDTFLEKYCLYQEKRRQERQERFNKIMEIREKQHNEKITLLKEFLNKM